MIVESEVDRQFGLSLTQALIVFGVHLLVCEGAPQALDENVIQGTALNLQREALATVSWTGSHAGGERRCWRRSQDRRETGLGEAGS